MTTGFDRTNNVVYVNKLITNIYLSKEKKVKTHKVVTVYVSNFLRLHVDTLPCQ